jgi:outer membrane protein assembly factor BamB
VLAWTLLPFSNTAGDWPQWRGPNFNGSSEEANLPAVWEKGDAVWAVEMPGPSAGTPVILGDKVFVSSTDRKTKSLQALCLDRKTGKILWQHKTSDRMERDDRSNYASPSPVADADRVFFFYGDGTFVAYDHDGKELWSRSVTEDHGEFAFLWTFSSTPLLHDGKLYLQVLQRDVPVQRRGSKPRGIESFLLAVDPATGKDLWKVDRPSEARQESREAFSSPVPFEYEGRKEILVAGGDCLTGHDPATGRELWRWGTWNPTRITHWRLVPSPVAGGGVVLACAPKEDPVYAIKAGGTGTLNDSAIAWTSEQTPDVTADVPTPLFYQGDFFVLAEEKRKLSRVEPATGRVKWTAELPGRTRYESSPTGADGKIYTMNFRGEVVVVEAESGKLLGTIPMGEPGDTDTRSTIAAAHGQLFIRTNGKLFCIAKK